MSVCLPLLWLLLSYLDSMFDCFCSSGCHVWLYFKCLVLPVLPVKVNVPSQNVLEICYNVTSYFVQISLVVTLTEIYFVLIGMCKYVRCNHSVEQKIPLKLYSETPIYTDSVFTVSLTRVSSQTENIKDDCKENDEREWFV